MKNLQFSFDGPGVNSWQNYLYSQDTIVIEDERIFIQTNFSDWLSERFKLTGAQLQFAADLGSAAQDYFASQIAEAISLRTPIVLEREEAEEGIGNSKTGSVTQVFIPVDGSSMIYGRRLIIKFYYS
ncbi:hypothetical protein [Sphingobacterium multivorum]|jgi:hypothetical protein|uniref:Uncharacterized protein n=1 Tax=Sphingobacterium multivorum TaxID=28454 RepID=A0A2X2J4E1_SPHMU|nr:hypothetical protein [Sphingobacterium multivorum]QRQ61220.1 hypothetical protein I6J33_24490 [Sphingobacterium multivorum]SPZ88504.1 Uncharacterised protein [Sphingobacterium multivorum]